MVEKNTSQNTILTTVMAPQVITASNNTTAGYSNVKPESVGMLVGLVSFYGIVAFIGITSNIFILLAICRKLVPRNTVNIFLASLALSDLLMVILSLFDCFAFINGGWILGTWSCKIQSLLIEVSFTASTLTLVAVSVERYLLICHPHMKRRSMRAIRCIVISLWVCGLAICSPLLHGYSVELVINEEMKTKELVCANNNWNEYYLRIFYIIYSVIIYVIPMLIMAFVHWRISVAVKVRRPSTASTFMIQDENSKSTETACYTIREESSGSSDVTAESNEFKRKPSVHKTLLTSLSALKGKSSTLDRDLNRREKRLKAIRLLFVVTVVFICLWTPFIVLRLLKLCGVHMNDYIYKFSEVLILSSTAVNGFIYAYMSPPFQKAFLSITCCKNRSEIWSRDSAPSMSNSEDNKFSQRMLNRTSTYSQGDSRNNTSKSVLIINSENI